MQTCIYYNFESIYVLRLWIVESRLIMKEGFQRILLDVYVYVLISTIVLIKILKFKDNSQSLKQLLPFYEKEENKLRIKFDCGPLH